MSESGVATACRHPAGISHDRQGACRRLGGGYMTSQLERTIAREREKLDAKDATASTRMRAISQEQADALMRELMLVTCRIDAASARGIDVHPDWLRRQSSYIRLLYQVDSLYSDLQR